MKNVVACCLALTLTLSVVQCASASADALVGRQPSSVDGMMRVYRDFAYGPRPDAPDEGARYPVIRGFKGTPVHTHRSGQLFDIYLPNSPSCVPVDAPVFLFVHGGAWSMRWDKDAEGYAFFKRLTEKGFVVFSMDYALQNDILSDPTVSRRPNAAFADMLRDIDLMVTHLKTFLPSIGLNCGKIALGGTSAGAHLTALYACDQSNPRPLGLGLRHDLSVGFVLDVVGPTNLRTPGMRGSLMAALRAAGDSGLCLSDAASRFATLLGWLTETDLLSLYRAKGESAVDEVLHHWSPVALVTPTTPPFLLAYNRIHPFSGTDGLVETVNCTEMEEALERVGVASESRFCWFRFHGQFTDAQLDWMADRCAALSLCAKGACCK